MLVANPQSPLVAPAPLSGVEAAFIKGTVMRFYGDEAVVRSFGPDSSGIEMHVETDRLNGMERYDCLGILFTRIERLIGLRLTKQGSRVFGNAELVDHQGVILLPTASAQLAPRVDARFGSVVLRDGLVNPPRCRFEIRVGYGDLVSSSALCRRES